MKQIVVIPLVFLFGICHGINRPEKHAVSNRLIGHTDAPVIHGMPNFVLDGGLRQEGNVDRQQQSGSRHAISTQDIHSQTNDPSSAIHDNNILAQRFQYQKISDHDENQSSLHAGLKHFQIPGVKYSKKSGFHSQSSSDFNHANKITPSQQLAVQTTATRVFPEFLQAPTVSRFHESKTGQSAATSRFPASEMRQTMESTDVRLPSRQFAVHELELRTRQNFPSSISASNFEISKIQESSRSTKLEPIRQDIPVQKLSFKQSDESTTFNQDIPMSVFQSQPLQESRFSESSRIISQKKDEDIVPFPQRRQQQQLIAQEKDRGVSTSGFLPPDKSTFSMSGLRQPFESVSENQKSHLELVSFHDTQSRTKPSFPSPSSVPLSQRFETAQKFETKTISQVPQIIEFTHSLVLPDSSQLFKQTLKDKVHDSQISQTQRLAAHETELGAKDRFPIMPPATHFQAPLTRQSHEPAFSNSQRGAAQKTHDLHNQLQQVPKQETETKVKSQFSPSSLSQVQRHHVFDEIKYFKPIIEDKATRGQTFQSQQFTAQEKEVRAQPIFPPPVSSTSHLQATGTMLSHEPLVLHIQHDDDMTTRDQRFQFKHQLNQEPETKTIPQFLQSPISPQVSQNNILDTRQILKTKVEEKETLGQILQSHQLTAQETEVRNQQPRFPPVSSASHLQATGTKQAHKPLILHTQRGDAITTPDQRLQFQHLLKQEPEANNRPQFLQSPVSHVPQSLISDTRQILKSTVEEKETLGQTFQSQLLPAQEIEVRAHPRFPQVSSASHFQATGVIQSHEPLISHTQRDDTDPLLQFQHILQQEPETIPQFLQSPVPQVPQSLISDTMQISKPKIEENEALGQTFQSQQFTTQETEVRAQPRFPQVSSASHFQATGAIQSQEPLVLHIQRDDAMMTPDQRFQFQHLLKQEPETKSRPQFVQSPTSQAPQSFISDTRQTSKPKVEEEKILSQTFQSQQFAAQETEVRDQPRFPQVSSTSHFQGTGTIQTQEPLVLHMQRGDAMTTHDQSLQFQHSSKQESETKTRPQILQSSISQIPQTHVSDTRQTSKSKVEGVEIQRPTFSSQQLTAQETEVRSQPRFPSIPSVSTETRLPSSPTVSLKTQREKVVTTQEQLFPTQQPTSLVSEKKILHDSSPLQISHIQVAGTKQPLQPFRPIVRQESFSIPQGFQTDLFRDVSYTSPPIQNRPNVALVKSHTIGPTDEGAYAFIFESEDGIIREEQGGFTQPDKGLTAKIGSFSYIAPDGTIVETSYVADERGYRSQSSPLARIHDPNLPAGKYDRYRSALALSQRNAQMNQNAKIIENQETKTRF